ncbi:MAG: TAXI family TRAP transporter solute-binding subunit [Rubrivivax sp.]
MHVLLPTLLSRRAARSRCCRRAVGRRAQRHRAGSRAGRRPGAAARGAGRRGCLQDRQYHSERGTYIQIGRDLAKFIAPAAQIELDALPSAGSPENIHRLRYEAGVKLALVQSDVYQAFINQGKAGDATAATIIRPLRVVLPLYNEEIYFVVRADSPMNYVHDIRDARINIGPLRSGTAMTTTTMYRLMFDQALPDSRLTTLTHEEALFKLTGDKSIDVVAIVAGQPAKLLTDMKAEARSLIKLLKLDPNNAASKAALKTFT